MLLVGLLVDTTSSPHSLSIEKMKNADTNLALDRTSNDCINAEMDSLNHVSVPYVLGNKESGSNEPKYIKEYEHPLSSESTKYQQSEESKTSASRMRRTDCQLSVN